MKLLKTDDREYYQGVISAEKIVTVASVISQIDNIYIQNGFRIGMLHGPSKIYFYEELPDGTEKRRLKKINNYYKDKLNGLQIHYNRAQKVEKIAYYSDDKLELSFLFEDGTIYEMWDYSKEEVQYKSWQV